MAIEIRSLKRDDARQWLRLRLEGLRSDPEAFSASAEEYEALSIEEVQRRLWSDRDAFVVGAFEEGRLLGNAGFFRDKGLKTRHKGRIWGVYVTPSRRGAGIARAMMRELLKRAEAIGGLEQVLLSVAATQSAAMRLYQSFGFEPFGCEPRALKIGERRIDETCMILRLEGRGK